jgi:hypothetical protein
MVKRTMSLDKAAIKMAEDFVGRKLTPAEMRLAMELVGSTPSREQVEESCIKGVRVLLETAKLSGDKQTIEVIDTSMVPVICGAILKWTQELFPEDLNRVSLHLGSLELMFVTPYNATAMVEGLPVNMVGTGQCVEVRNAAGEIVSIGGHALVSVESRDHSDKLPVIKLDPCMESVVAVAAEKSGIKYDVSAMGTFRCNEELTDEINEVLAKGAVPKGPFAETVKALYEVSKVIIDNDGKEPVVC